MAMSHGICRGCGASILWVRTAAAKSMPCDPVLLPYWQEPAGREKIVTQSGEVVSAWLEGLPGMETGMGYISHFATCPERDRFRKKSREQGI